MYCILCTLLNVIIDYRSERAERCHPIAETWGVRVKLESQQPISRGVVAYKCNVMAEVSWSEFLLRARSNLIERSERRCKEGIENGMAAKKKKWVKPSRLTRLRRLILQMHGHSRIPTRRAHDRFRYHLPLLDFMWPEVELDWGLRNFRVTRLRLLFCIVDNGSLFMCSSGLKL